MQNSMSVRFHSAVGVSHKTCLKPTVPALRVRCQSQSSNNANSRIQEARGVFQMIPQRGEATLLDARCLIFLKDRDSDVCTGSL